MGYKPIVNINPLFGLNMKLPVFLLGILSLPLSKACWPQMASLFSFSGEVQNIDKTPSSFSGEVLRSNKTHNFPSSLVVKWMNFIEGDDVRDGTAWRWTGGSSRLNASDFSLDMGVDEKTFGMNITTSPKILDRWSEHLKDDPKSAKQFESFKLAFGQIFGVYNNDEPSESSVIGNDASMRIISKGPHNETARADIYAVFYKQGTLDTFAACNWFSKLPQGFSCGRGAPADKSCNRIFEIFTPIECNKIVVKVASRFCSRDEQNLDDPRPDCHLRVNWT